MTKKYIISVTNDTLSISDLAFNNKKSSWNWNEIRNFMHHKVLPTPHGGKYIFIPHLYNIVTTKVY
jgi:hypothetical protein